MKRILTMSLAVLVAAAVAAPILAQTPEPPSWPPGKMQVFVAANTVGTDGQQNNVFQRGASVVFQAYAVDLKTKKVLTAKDVTYFYVKIAGQPNVKLTFGPQGKAEIWTGTWTIPADYPLGVVDYRVLVKTKAKRYGAFFPVPVAPAMLTVIAKA